MPAPSYPGRSIIGKDPHLVREWLARYTREAPMTSLFSLVAVLVWAVTAFQSRSLTNSLAGSGLGDAWILWGPALLSEPLGVLRTIGSIFLHLDLGHLAVNLFFLVLVGREIERFCGSALYATVFFSGGIGASAAILWLAPLVPTAGASGALYALLAVFVTVSYRRGADLRAPLILIGINVAYTFVATSVSLWGHLGGLGTGAVLALVLASRSRRTQVTGVVVVLTAAIAAVVWWVLDTIGLSLVESMLT